MHKLSNLFSVCSNETNLHIYEQIVHIMELNLLAKAPLFCFLYLYKRSLFNVYWEPIIIDIG